MNAIRICRTLTSETLPELKPLIGRSVEIIVFELAPHASSPDFTPGTGDWDAFRRAADTLRPTFDYAAIDEQNAVDQREAERQIKVD